MPYFQRHSVLALGTVHNDDMLPPVVQSCASASSTGPTCLGIHDRAAARPVRLRTCDNTKMGDGVIDVTFCSADHRQVAPVPRAWPTHEFVADLAWSLAGAVKPHLSIVERNHVYVAIGIDETFTAIHRLITSAATNQIALPGELVQRCGTWLDAFADHSQQQHLRRLVEDVLAPLSARDSFASYGDSAPK
jgi:hypothetical protein